MKKKKSLKCEILYILNSRIKKKVKEFINPKKENKKIFSKNIRL